MPLENTPFQKYNDEKKSDTFTVWLSPEDRAMLEESKNVLQQEKDSTALKQLAFIGHAVLLGDKKIAKIVDVVMNNKRKNKRLGVVTYDDG